MGVASFFNFLKTSGRASLKYIMRAFGIPAFLHSETDAGSISQSLAVADVPPSASMILSGECSWLIARILGAPRNNCKYIF